MTPFQLIVTGIFGAFIIIGVGVFALFGGLGGGGGAGPVTVWGTLSGTQMESLLITLRATDKTLQDVTYIEKSPESYEQELVSAMAAGRGPDLFFVSHEEMTAFADKVLTIPYSIVSQREFTTTFVDEGRLFLSGEGALALPVTIDPLVMYWNRDLFASAGVPAAPQYWNDFLTLAPRLTAYDTASAVRRSAAALGEWQNIANAKAILSALFLQAGVPVVAVGESGAYSALAMLPEGAVEAPAQSALRFYTEFGNPSKSVYSWNRSLPEAQTAFAAGDVGVYFGFASEYEIIRQRNPNLNLGVELLPQIQGAGTAATYGALAGVAVARTAQKPQGAAAVAQRLAGQEVGLYLRGQMGLIPARREFAIGSEESAAASVFAQSALIARGWLDPNPTETDTIFRTMVESVSSGRATPAEAVNDASRLLDDLLR
jgi:ABC-type glycerol-3-phosphate transport system substrate-binding protein